MLKDEIQKSNEREQKVNNKVLNDAEYYEMYVGCDGGKVKLSFFSIYSDLIWQILLKIYYKISLNFQSLFFLK